MHITTQYLANEEKAVVANSKVEALESEASGLRKDLITTMDSLNASKEQVQALTEQLDAKKQSVKVREAEGRTPGSSCPEDESCCGQGRHCLPDHGRI